MKKDKKECPMGKMSRRDFFKKSALFGTGVMIGANSEFQSIGHKEPWDRPRVVRAYSPDATDWDYSSNYYFDYVDQDVVNEMLMQGVLALTRGDINKIVENYNPGDQWAIKINCNNYADASNEIDATAPSINAVLRLLIEFLNIPDEDIYIYDTSRPIPNFRIQNRVSYGVNFVESGDPLAAADPLAPITFRNISTQYMPLVVSRAQHLIDLHLFKDHLFCLSTMTFKNHFGTTRPGPSYLHSPIHTNLSDLNANSNIKLKTRLNVGDALFGVWDGGPYGWPMQWDTFPGGRTPNSLFLGFDPVAHESVMIDYLIEEQEYHGVPLLSHEFLHDAMEYNHLGVHEHRDESGNYRYIDFVEVSV